MESTTAIRTSTIPYPKLVIDPASGDVFLMLRKSEGVKVFSKALNGIPIGVLSYCWDDHFWIDYDGKVTISN